MDDAGGLRVGNDERDHVIVLLRAATDEGRLTPEERDERIARTASARTYADLDALVADIPVPAPSRALLRGAAPRPDDRLGWSAARPLRLSGGWSTEKRTGYWEIPPFLRINGDWGTVKLDCRQAVCLQPVIHVDVSGGAGTITFIVPDDWAADTDQLAKSWGTIRNKTNRVQLPGRPLLVFVGSAGMGTITVRPARKGERRRLAKRLALEGPSTPRELPPGSSSAWVQSNPTVPNQGDLR